MGWTVSAKGVELPGALSPDNGLGGVETTEMLAADRELGRGGQRQSERSRSSRAHRRGEKLSPQERGARTQRAIAEALISLVDSSDKCPTAFELAGRAGVSVRLVYHHFGDMEGVYEAAARVTAERYWQSVPVVQPSLPLTTRIHRVVLKRAVIYERIGKLRRAVIRVDPERPQLAATVAERNELLRSWLTTTFEPELAAAGAKRPRLLSAIEVVTSWEAWDQLRRAQDLNVIDASRTMRICLEGLLGRDREGS